MNKAVFLDRDGIINLEKGYIKSSDDIVFTDNIIKNVRLLNINNFKVIVVTNQSGVARGYFDTDAIYNIHNYINSEMKKEGAHIDAFYFCPHHEDGTVPEFSYKCSCRKPGIGMLMSAKENFNLDFSHSYIIGDKITDVEAGAKAGLKKSYLLETNDEITNIVNDIFRKESLY